MGVEGREFINALTDYKELFAILAIIFGLCTLGVLIYAVMGIVTKYSQNAMRKKHEITKEDLRNLDYRKVRSDRKAEILREMVAPDGLDTGTNSYLVLNDGGVDYYVRTFTIATLPKRASFADTFSSLLDFPECTSTILVTPTAEATISRKMDRQVTVLGAEYASAAGDPNRERKIRSQFNEVNSWAEEVEEGENKFFRVGFVFSLVASSLQQLNKISDTFKSKALSKSIVITNCYAVQPEAYLFNAPCGNYLKIGSSYIKADAVNYFDMDKYSVSTIFNYTQTSFSHKDGIILGRDMGTAEPVLYDIFDPSHDGYTLVIAGKTGSGKSATIKMYAARSMIHGYRYVCIDSQLRKGTAEGEFAGIAELYNGINYKISNDSEYILNPFEVGETSKTVKQGSDMVRDVRTLELKEKIGMVVNTLLTMIQGSKSFKNLESMIPISRILTDIVTTLYHDFGIEDDDPDSLYTMGDTVEDGVLRNGRIRKPLPTMTDFYKRLLLANLKNKDSSLNEYYSLAIMALKDFVKELYYSKETITFFTREEYMSLPMKDASGTSRVFVNKANQTEDVEQVHGIRAYYDGQTNVTVSRDCPFTNIDISSLSENEKILARQIAMDYLNESFIKKNSESIDTASKLVGIFDECHENFVFEYARKTLDNVVRTARKRHVGIILSSQTLAEYNNYKETQAILKQATSKFVFKQDYQDRSYLINEVGFTEAQTDYILNSLGGASLDDDQKGRHRGEMCIMDNKNVCFCKVDYLKETEALAVETNASEIEKLFHRAG